MWTIKEAADRAGLSPDVLRAWERRYGVVRPTRTASGYRLYSEADVARLRGMRRLMEEGFKPREAAQELARSARAVSGAGFGAASAGRSDAPPSAGPAPEPGSGAHTAPAAARSRLIAAAADLDVAALSAYFDELGARGTFETVCEEYLFPGFRALGEAWADGTVSVAGEHAASAAALRWLGAQYQAAGRDARAPQALVALPPGARHELGALAHAVALRRNGVDVLYLGPDLPVEDLAAAVRTTGARVAVLGAVIAADVPGAERAAAALTKAPDDVRLAFGGAAGDALGAYGTVLPEGLTAAASAVLGMLGARNGERG